MSKVIHTNTTNAKQHFGPYTLNPGETREVEACFLPYPTQPEEVAPFNLVEWLDEFVGQKPAAQIPLIPELSDEQFYVTLEYYLLDENKPQKNLATAIQGEVARRGEPFQDYVFAQELKALPDADLQESLLANAEDPLRLALVQAELSARAQ